MEGLERKVPIDSSDKVRNSTINAFLAGALALGPVPNHPNQVGSEQQPAAPYSEISYDSTYGTSYESSGTYERGSTLEAVQAFQNLTKELESVGLTVTEEQRAIIRNAIDVYVNEHPAVPGTSTEIKDANGVVTGFESTPTYNPLYELWSVASKSYNGNPLVTGLLLQELSTRMGTTSSSYESTESTSVPQE